MLAFVDESGDPGLKIDRGSSRFFVVTVVTFADADEAQSCDDRIADLREALGLPAGYEFHFSHNSNRVREAFLAAVSPHPFFYHVFALNKDPERLTGPGFAFKDSLYKFAARLTFENARPYLDDATVVIDKSGDRKFRNELATYLRRRINDADGPRRIRKVKIQRSEGNNLLQLADYVAGVSARALNGKQDGARWRARYFRPHELSRRIWP